MQSKDGDEQVNCKSEPSIYTLWHITTVKWAATRLRTANLNCCIDLKDIQFGVTLNFKTLMNI